MLSITLMTILTPDGDAAPGLTLVLTMLVAGCSALFYLAELFWVESMNCLDLHELS